MQLQDARPFVEERRHAALAVVDDEGYPHVSRIVYAAGDDGLLRVSVTDGRVKTGHLRSRPRATLHVRGDDDWHWVSIVADVELSDVAHDPDGDVATELLGLYEQVSGPHDDPRAFRRAMVDDQRLVLRLTPRSAHGQL